MKKPFYPTLKKSCERFFASLKSVVLIMLVDIAFFIIMAGVFTKVWERSMVHVEAVLEMMDISMEQLAGAQTEAQLSALAARQGEFMAHYWQIGYYVAMLFVSLLVFWCIFQGVNWFLTEGMAEKKEHRFWKYMGKFTLLSFIWWIVFVVIVGIGLKMSFYSSMAILPLAGKGFARVLILILMFLLFSMAYTSYTLMPKCTLKQVFRKLFSAFRDNYKAIFPVFIFLAAVLVIEYLFFLRAFMFGGYGPALFAVIVIFPTISWSRFYVITALEKLD
jgi:hypothetical protein